MNTLSKTQVIALFLGTTSAAPIDIVKAVADVGQVPTGQDLMTASSGAACNGLGGCDAAGEKCGRAQLADGTTSDACVWEEWCGALGREGNSLFGINCWTAVAEGATPTAPANVDLAADFAAVESLITKTTLNWDAETDILVSPRFNFQDGWFTKNAEDKWAETDKPSDNRCFLDLQCDSDKCCASYPDTNNRRCILSTEHGISITVGPVTFKPACASKGAVTDDEEVVPENAKDDIAKGALSKANEELVAWAANELADAKKAAGYDEETCDQACKDKFDADWKAEVDKFDEFVKGIKTAAGYDETECDDACKAVFEADLLKWQKEVYETCKADSKSIQCVKAEDIKNDVEKSRGKEYYTGDEEKRNADDTAREEADKALEATLTAAWLEENKPAAGKAGGECSESVLCDTGLCCGTMTKEGATTAETGSFCADATSLKWANVFEENFTHVCTGLNAMKIGSSIAAAAVAAYYM